jgi:hypothetical protein
MRKRVAYPLVVVLVVLGVAMASLPFVIAALDGGGSAPRDLALSVGTGGGGCALGVASTKFTTTDKIRLVIAAAPGPGDVTIWLYRLPLGISTDQVPGYPTTRHVGSAGCVFVDLPPLPASGYQASVFVGDPGEAPIARGSIDFDVSS